MRVYLTFLLIVLLAGACQTAVSEPTPTAITNQFATPVNPETLAQTIPALAARQAAITAVLQQNLPILTLPDLADAENQAQALALQNDEFLRYLTDSQNGEPLLSEVMVVRPSLPSDLEGMNIPCTPDQCFRVEMYNYAHNLTTIAFVDLASNEVVFVNHLLDVQPEIPPVLADLAAQIAIHSPEVQAALGLEPEADTAVMPNVKTALNGTLCERSNHLCVAPTFIQGERALWAIVDLTDQQLVGIRWTELGESGGTAVTERSLQNEIVYQEYCQQSQTLSQDEWQMTYMLTSSDGLKLTDVTYQGQPVMNSAKLVDWHVSYSGSDGFGYSDAVGCPIFSSAAVVAFNGPMVEPIVQNGETVGFALVQDFRSTEWPVPCNYRYEQRYEFYNDGRFRVVAGNHGRGCGDNGTYRPVLRLDIAASADGQDNFAEWDGQSWTVWTEEGWQLQDENTMFTPEGYQYKWTGADGRGYFIEPGQGQFADNGRGDNAFVFVTKNDPGRDEGESDLASIGSCCNTDFQQGPEQFLTEPESIENENLVLWYVPQLENEATPGQEYCWADTVIENGVSVARSWPCFAGPMFVPFLSDQ